MTCGDGAANLPIFRADCTEYNLHSIFHRVLSGIIRIVLYRTTQPVVPSYESVPKNPNPEQAPHATHPSDERGTHGVPVVNPNDAARWLVLADTALRMGATEVVGKSEILARKEQAAIKKRIRRTAEQVNRHSKSKQ